MIREKIDDVKQFIDPLKSSSEGYAQFWYEETFLHWDFWFSWAMTILPWMIWWRFRKRDSTFRLLLVGAYALIVSSFLDFIGVHFGLWYYAGKALPLLPTYIPWDWTLIPIFIMTLLQVKPNAHWLIKGLILGAVASFIAEPIFELLGFYKSLNWKYYYSFPIYVILYYGAHRLSKVKTQFEPLN